MRIYKNFFFILLIDALLLCASLYAANLIRFDFHVPGRHLDLYFWALPVVLPVKLGVFYFFDLYRGMWRYTSISELINVIKASFSSTLLIIFLLLYINRFEGYSRSVFVIDLLLTILLISGFRIAVRLFYEGAVRDMALGSVLKTALDKRTPSAPGQKRLLIIGAGDCGEKMHREIRDNGRLQFKVVGFVDDDPVKRGKKIHGIPVQGPVSRLRQIGQNLKAQEVLIAVPSARGHEMRRIVKHCKQSGLDYKTVPGLGELIDGRVTSSSIRDVAYQDLLGREAVRLDQEKIGSYLRGQCVLVTGAGGSIGSELSRQICRYRPGALVLFERGEYLLYQVEMEVREKFPDIEIVPLLADIQDSEQVKHFFRQYRPQIIFHAAAYKHVAMLESQPWSPVKNNILGTSNLIQASQKFGVQRFVFVSTDKAVRPASIMGASKRVAEMLVQKQSSCNTSQGPRFVSVRFGNVVGSAGSVVPLFQKQIEKGGPVTVTHPDMTRYFMTISEACQLILQAGGMGQGGEIYILDMGRSIRIVDMARDLIRLSGFEPEQDIEIQYTGLRPGEKLFEELIAAKENVSPTAHEKIMVIRGGEGYLDDIEEKVDLLVQAALSQDEAKIRTLCKQIISDFQDR